MKQLLIILQQFKMYNQILFLLADDNTAYLFIFVLLEFLY